MFALDLPLEPVEVFEAIQAHAENLESIFLVGGVVRDLLLRRPIHDIDLVLAGDVRSLAKKVANSLDGDFFMLDAERETARVLYGTSAYEKLVIDFAAFRGKTLLEDLQARDFTINAMALALNHPTQVIDPLNGAQDLRNKILRLCHPDALRSDPLRVIRGVRFALNLGCKISPETWRLMKEAAPGLSKISAERKRDEIFRILSGSDISSAFRLLDRAGAMGSIFPELLAYNGNRAAIPGLAEHFEAVMVKLQKLEVLLDALGEANRRRSVQNMISGTAVLQLNRFHEQVRFHLEQQISSGRKARELLFLAGLIRGTFEKRKSESDAGTMGNFEPESEPVNQVTAVFARSLALSQVELKRLGKTIASVPLFYSLAGLGKDISPKDIYCYFRDAGDAGIDAAFLVMADILAAYRSSLPQDLWLDLLVVVERVWEAWWNQHQEVVDPPQILTGNDLQHHFNIQPGPVVGAGLEAVREAQVEGKIATKEDAFKFLAEWFKIIDRKP